MNITVIVFDGVHGQPAEGIAVSIGRHSHDSQIGIGQGHANEKGQFRYAANRSDITDGETYYIEINIESYFATLGIASSQRRIIIFFRVFGEDEFRIASLITPFAQTTCQIR